MHESGSDLSERLQNKLTAVHPRMRHDESVLAASKVAKERQVDVDRPRAVGFVPHASQAALDVEKNLQNLASRQVGLELRRGVQVTALSRRPADGFGLQER